MTEQSPSDRLNRASNDILEATSFLSGTNAAFLEALYAQYLANPSRWIGLAGLFRAAWAKQGLTPTQLGRGPAWRRDQKSARFRKDESPAALTGQAAPAKSARNADKAKPAANARAAAQRIPSAPSRWCAPIA